MRDEVGDQSKAHGGVWLALPEKELHSYASSSVTTFGPSSTPVRR